MLRIALLAAAVSVTFVAPVSAAEYQREPTEVHVSDVGVDFANAAQVRLFHAKLARAAREACDSDMPMDSAVTAADRQCAHDSLDRAVAGVNQPQLSAYHANPAMQQVQLARAGH